MNKNYFNLYKDIWEIHKKYIDVNLNYDYNYDCLMNDFSRILDNTPDNLKEFCISLSRSLWFELLRNCKVNQLDLKVLP